MVIGTVRMLDLGLKVYVFKQADQYVAYPQKLNGEATEVEQERMRMEQVQAEEVNIRSRRQSTASSSLAMIIVGLPLFLYHWKIISDKK